MKTFQKTQLALAIAALLASPFALAGGPPGPMPGDRGNDFDTDSDIDSEFENDIDVDIEHNADTDKYINVYLNAYVDPTNVSGATVDSKQLIDDNQSDNFLHDNNATLGGNALTGASGNIGVNNAAGSSNAQANDAALAASDAETVFGQAAAYSAQSSSNNSNVPDFNGPALETSSIGWFASSNNNNALLGGNALQNATGNIGVNNVAGYGNAQQNSLAASVNTASGSADATTAGVQSTYDNQTANSGHIEVGVEMVGVELALNMQGGYQGVADQRGDQYLDTWDGALDHPSGNSTGHIDVDQNVQNAQDGFVDNDGDGVDDDGGAGAFAFDEAGTIALSGTVSGSIPVPTLTLNPSENNARLNGNFLRGASGNIGVNNAAGHNNLQRNSLSIAASTGGAAGGGGGGGGEQ